MTRSTSILALVAAMVLAACGGATPSKPELSDPKAILSAAAEQASGAQGVHIDASADGSLSVDLTGSGNAAPVDVTGSTASADVALASGDARVTFELAGAIRGELRIVDHVAYLKTTLTGAQYQIQEGFPSIPPNSVPAALDAFVDLLDEPGIDPLKGPDTECAGGSCYQVTMTITGAELSALGLDTSALAMAGLDEASVDLVVLVTKDTNDLSSVEAALTSADGETLTVVSTFSKWGDAVTVEAPSPEEIAPAG